jgi:hypothetical protein
MKTSKQDKYYLDVEADAFLERNRYDFKKLPEKKKKLVEFFEDQLNKKKISNVLEIGCHIGDLLNYTVESLEANAGFGVEPSGTAVDEGNRQFGEKCRLVKGVAGDDKIFSGIPVCDLVLINDVFCWISRETIFQSVSNIDDHVSDGGYLLIRDFLPDRRIRNHNRHAGGNPIYCHKIPGSHASIFIQSGNYQIVQSRIFVDESKELSATDEYDFMENRWLDILLKKGW